MIESTRQVTGSGTQLGSILAYVDGGEGSEYVIRTAAQLGETHACYVEVLHIVKEVDTALLAMDVGGSLVASTEIFRMMKEDSVKREACAKAAFDKYCQTMGTDVVHADSKETLSYGNFTLSWNSISGNDGRDLAHRGRLFDLLVMAKANDQVGGVDSIQMEAALFDTGRPLLVVAGKDLKRKFSTIVIAWDGSREAAHCVALSLPFLSQAKQVYIMSVGQRDPGMEIEDLGRYLERHGVKAEYCQFSNSKNSVAYTLIDASLEKGADLVVMGAYGHSAIGESLFGGVTRDFLENGKISLFLAH